MHDENEIVFPLPLQTTSFLCFFRFIPDLQIRLRLLNGETRIGQFEKHFQIKQQFRISGSADVNLSVTDSAKATKWQLPC